MVESTTWTPSVMLKVLIENIPDELDDLAKDISFFLNKCIYFIFLFLAVLGLRCCAWAFSSCGKGGLLFIAVCGLLIAVASLVTKHGL